MVPGCFADGRRALPPTWNFGSVGGAEAVWQDALTEIALGGGVGILVHGAGGFVGTILAVAGVTVAKEFLQGSDSDSCYPYFIMTCKYVTRYVCLFGINASDRQSHFEMICEN